MSEMVYRPEVRDTGWRPRCWFIGMNEKSSAYCLTCPFRDEAEFEDGSKLSMCSDMKDLQGRPAASYLEGYEEHIIKHALELLDPVARLTMNGQGGQALQNVLDAIANLEALL